MTNFLSLASYGSHRVESVPGNDSKYNRFSSSTPATLDFLIHASDRTETGVDDYSNCSFILPNGGLKGVIGYQTVMFACETKCINIIDGVNNTIYFGARAELGEWYDYKVSIEPGDYSIYNGPLTADECVTTETKGFYTDSLQHAILLAMKTACGLDIRMNIRMSNGKISMIIVSHYMRLNCSSTNADSIHRVLGFNDRDDLLTTDILGSVQPVTNVLLGSLTSDRAINVDRDLPLSIVLSSDVWSSTSIVNTGSSSKLMNWIAVIPYTIDTATDRLMWTNTNDHPAFYSWFSQSKVINQFKIHISDENGKSIPNLGRWILKLRLYINR